MNIEQAVASLASVCSHLSQFEIMCGPSTGRIISGCIVPLLSSVICEGEHLTYLVWWPFCELPTLIAAFFGTIYRYNEDKVFIFNYTKNLMLFYHVQLPRSRLKLLLGITRIRNMDH